MVKSWQVWRSSLLLVGVIVMIGAGLRLYRINDIPYGFTWDEAAITYNAWSISLWGKDEWGVAWPLVFRSFGDYKAPLTIYMLAFFYRLWGVHPELLRILIALCGVGTVVAMYGLARSLDRTQKTVALGAALGMAVSPWALAFSRAGFEATLGLLLVIIGMALAIRRQTMIGGAVCLTLSLYAYHSPKLVVPFLLLLLIPWLKKWWWVVVGSVGVGALPLIIAGHGVDRARTLVMLSGQNLMPILIHNLTAQLGWRFWVGGVDSIGLQHGVPGFGVVLLPELMVFLVGLIVALRRRLPADFLMVGWLVAGLLPSLLSIDAPHSLRALLALPAVLWLSAVGMVWLWRKGRIAAVAMVVAWVCIFGYYLTTYYGSYATASAAAFQYGYKEAMWYVSNLGRRKAQIVVTTAYGQPYIYTLLYRQITPLEYLSGGLANLSFRPIDWPETQVDTLYLGTPDEIPATDPAAIGLITVPGTQQVVFVAAETP